MTCSYLPPPPLRAFVFAMAGLMLASFSGCSSAVRSLTDTDSAGSTQGLRYWLPSRDLVVSVNVVDTPPPRVSTLTIVASAPFADLNTSGPFTAVLVNDGWKNGDSKISVTTGGLLTTSASSKSLAGGTAIAQALGNLAGTVSAMEAPTAGTPPAAPTACRAGTQSQRITPNLNGLPQEVVFEPAGSCTVTIVYSPSRPMSATAKNTVPRCLGVDGRELAPSEVVLYYRTDLPVFVTATLKEGVAGNVEPKVLADRFGLPQFSAAGCIQRRTGAFSDVDHIVTIENGMVTSEQLNRKPSEVAGVLTAPAEVIKAYFGAIGALFTSKSAANTAETNAVDDSTSIESARLKNEITRLRNARCASAIQSGDDAAISAKCAGL